MAVVPPPRVRHRVLKPVLLAVRLPPAVHRRLVRQRVRHQRVRLPRAALRPVRRPVRLRPLAASPRAAIAAVTARINAL